MAECAAIEAKLLISEILRIKPNQLFLYNDRCVNAAEAAQICELCRRRADGEPLQYILQKAYFRDLELFVNENVLVPRPETEILVQYVLDHAPPAATVLDLGTGSGAIALAIATERTDCTISAVDYSSKAMEVAAKNFASYQQEIDLRKSDLFSALSGQRYDVIAANLPYVTADEYQQLPYDVLHHEPVEALVSPEDGLLHIKRTIVAAPEFLNDNGFIVFEFGDFQTAKVEQLLIENGKFTNINRFADLNGIERFIAATKK